MTFRFVSVLLALACTPLHAGSPTGWSCEFEDSPRLTDWTTEGGVTLQDGGAFEGSRCLRLSRSTEKIDLPCSATGPAFPATPGEWEIGAAGKPSLESPDSSYNGKVWLECLDGAGRVAGRFPIADFAGKKEWQTMAKRCELPEGTAAARFRVELNKASGVFLADNLSAAYAGPGRAGRSDIDRILFQTEELGNLLYPQTPRRVHIAVDTFRELSAAQRQVTCVIRDYWGAEQAAAVTLPLAPTGRTTYEADLDFSGVPLEVGRYYEVSASVLEKQGPASTNHTSLTILPEATTRQYKPEEIPFTSRTWDNRIAEFYPLSARLGFRICGVRGSWSAEPPYEAEAPRIDLCAKLGMGALTTTPIARIEHRIPGYEKLDDTALRQGIRALVAKIGPVRPLVINLGNEPASSGETLSRNVTAYRAVYEELKKIDPSITVVSSSTGPAEDYFKLGFGQWCDAYDFHTYEDAASVRRTIAKYRELFEKYGHPHPIWATELGLNSQGLERRIVAGELIRKVTYFFAMGGSNVSWFGLLYPDADLKLQGGSEDCHNVFDCRYARYAPRLDAIAYYNMINGIGIKKFVEEKTYPNGVYAALFRDRDGRSLQVLWRETGDTNVVVPLPETDAVQVIHIDGLRRELRPQGRGRGVTLTVGADPLLLLYDRGTSRLAPDLATSSDSLTYPPELVRGTAARLTVRAGDAPTLMAPPLWKIGQDNSGGEVRYTVTPPEDSQATEADFLVTLRDIQGNPVGELSARPRVSGRLSLRVVPEPAAVGQPPGVRLVFGNRGAAPLAFAWNADLSGAMGLQAGKMAETGLNNARLTGDSSGTLTVQPGEVRSLTLPLSGIDPLNLYRVHVTATEPGHTPIAVERLVGGFVGVLRVSSPPKLDGTLNDPAWQKASPQMIDQARQFAYLGKGDRPWRGPSDLSGRLRFLWDDRYLYIGVEVTDDLPGGRKRDAEIWAQDGLQFLIDPAREVSPKTGKYDYAAALGANGPQVWCYSSADPNGAPVGDAKDVVLAAKRTDAKTGSMTYEVALPWSRVAPFLPAPGADLGLTLILNEDDGQGRDSFMTWFGNAHTKQVDTAGDLVLLP